MKFSYSLLKKFVPALKSKRQAIDMLTLHSFEVEDAGGNAIEVKLPPNRYGDASGHLGIARELATGLGVALRFPKSQPLAVRRAVRSFSVNVEDPKRCPRYAAAAFEGVRVAPSPAWLVSVLVDCGLRPISNVVDIMNYVMLETGQPLHAFDLDKLEKHSLVVRPSRAGERIVTIDNQDIELPVGTLVIADAKRPQAIAGVKGGSGAEVTAGTTRIVVEAATFEPSAIYRTARAVNIVTDAAQRFARGMPISLPPRALERATELLMDIAGARQGDSFDSNPKPLAARAIQFDVERYRRFIGMSVDSRRVKRILESLGFTAEKGGRWQAPPLRMDIETFEDLAEEVARFVGYGMLPSAAPRVALAPPADDPHIAAKTRVRSVLTGLGFDEVYTNSFIARDAARAFEPASAAVYLENPLSDLVAALRPSLIQNLTGAVEMNARFFDSFELFEVGKVFQHVGSRITERLVVGCALVAKKRETFFELKSALEELLKAFGIRNVSFELKPNGGTGLLARAAMNGTDGVHTLTVMAEGKPVGYVGAARRSPRDWHVAVAELDLEAIMALASANVAFAPLPLFPSVVRDLSLRLPVSVRIGEVIRAAQAAMPALMDAVDLVDEYVDPSWKGEQSITLRFIFQAPDRTLTAAEVDRLVEEVGRSLARDFKATIR